MGDALMLGHSSCCRVFSVFPKVVKCVDNRFCGFWLKTLTNCFWVNRWCHFLDHFINIIFQWCSYTHNSDQHICWTRICFKNGWIYGMVSQLPIMWGVSPSLPYPTYWASTWPLCWASVQACPNRLAWRFTQQMGKGLIILLPGVQALP
jgi:hypothetical protein